MQPLLKVRDLSVKIPTRFGEFKAVDAVDLDVEAGQIHGLVGESGAGKSTIAAAIIGLLEAPAFVSTGSIELTGEALTHLHDDAYHRLRGKRISMIFQDPQTSLNPLLTISDQLIETIRQHRDVSYVAARLKAIALLEETGIDNAEQRLDDYPHQFSGGMRQRVVIALALCTDPELIIADEPTTALDVSIQKQILELIQELTRNRGVGIILITHDIGVIAEITDVVTVLRYGRVVEHGNTAKVLGDPDETYTRQLMAAVPRLDKRIERFVNIVADDHRVDAAGDWAIEGAAAQQAASWLLKEQTLAKSNVNASIKDSSNNDSSSSLPPDSTLLEVADLSVVFEARQKLFSKQPGVAALKGINVQLQSRLRLRCSWRKRQR